VKRKEFEKLFATFNENGKQIWVIGRVKDLPKPIVNMALNLSALDFIKYIRF
jgi:phosphoribosylaminoimidazole (AIR) synthetase